VDLKIEYYTFDDRARYDFVSMIELLEHVSDPAAYLRGAHRVLADDGCAYLTFAVRMPQLDHLYQFDSVEECRQLAEAAGFRVVEDYCTINTHQPFAEAERWGLAADPKYAVTYCCLVRKQTGREAAALIEDFNDDLDL
jgi:SAM-dependent methyltransferase